MYKKIFTISAAVSVTSFAMAYGLWAASGLPKDKGYFSSMSSAYAGTLKGASTVIVDKKLDVGAVTKMNIDLPAMDFNVDPSTDKQLSVVFVGDMKRYKPEDLKIEISNGTINISLEQSKEKRVNFVFGYEEKLGITLKVPNNIQELDIKSVSADGKFKDVNFSKLTFTSVSGDLDFKNVKIGEFVEKTTSGDLEYSGELKSLVAKTTSGDLKLDLKSLAPDIKVASVSGDTAVKFASAPDVQLSFSSVSGDFEMKSDNASEESSAKHIKKTLGKGTGSIAVETVSGDLAIQ
jgi:DUF4097 and DUF4098 domain-containing protein YvlB